MPVSSLKTKTIETVLLMKLSSRSETMIWTIWIH